MNPPKYDASVLHNLKQRYYTKLIYVRLCFPRKRIVFCCDNVIFTFSNYFSLFGFSMNGKKRSLFHQETLEKALGRVTTFYSSPLLFGITLWTLLRTELHVKISRHRFKAPGQSTMSLSFLDFVTECCIHNVQNSYGLWNNYLRIGTHWNDYLDEFPPTCTNISVIHKRRFKTLRRVATFRCFCTFVAIFPKLTLKSSCSTTNLIFSRTLRIVSYKFIVSPIGFRFHYRNK